MFSTMVYIDHNFCKSPKTVCWWKSTEESKVILIIFSIYAADKWILILAVVFGTPKTECKLDL